MKQTYVASLIVFSLATAVTPPGRATEQDLHAERFACTTCHTVSPGPEDTLETAPLVLPRPDLCLACHGDTHGGE